MNVYMFIFTGSVNLYEIHNGHSRYVSVKFQEGREDRGLLTMNFFRRYFINLNIIIK